MVAFLFITRKRAGAIAVIDAVSNSWIAEASRIWRFCLSYSPFRRNPESAPIFQINQSMELIFAGLAMGYD